MKKEIKTRWLAALRSGQYKQTRNTLTDGKRFCCLGVLCNLHAIETGRTWQETSDAITYGFQHLTLPPSVMEWAELDSKSPVVGNRKLSEANDQGMSFKKIAELIDAHL